MTVFHTEMGVLSKESVTSTELSANQNFIGLLLIHNVIKIKTKE